MPSPETFTLAPVATLLDRWITHGAEVIDPFARNCVRGTYTNDLNPNTDAATHLDAREFCDELLALEVVADAVLFDPPYSPRQITECYQSFGRKATTEDTQNARLYREVKDRLAKLLRPGGVAVSCGWNSTGFGKLRGFEIAEILLVAHGGAHNDTIVVVEKKCS